MPQLIEINSTDTYPDIFLDKENGIFEIKGISLPENGKELYQPILDFLSEYKESPATITHFIFNLRYFNISSSKMILFILYKLKELHVSGNSVLVTWCYDDDDILEAGKDFEHMVAVPFMFKEVFGN
jgi:hypothetical protein